ncbi:MAG: hypothetical protein ABL891_03040 [Burkholderiales bacterium]
MKFRSPACLILLFLSCCIPNAALFAQSERKISAASAAEKWTPFRNIEFWEYCLSLPLNGYTQNYKKSDVKAKHVFTHRTKKNTDITVWGLDNAQSKASPEAYFKRYYANAEETGLIIEDRKLDAKARRFYGWGYWSNAFYETRFLEIVWLRDSEVIKFHAAFPVADADLWKSRLPELLKQTTVCKPE